MDSKLQDLEDQLTLLIAKRQQKPKYLAGAERKVFGRPVVYDGQKWVGKQKFSQRPQRIVAKSNCGRLCVDAGLEWHIYNTRGFHYKTISKAEIPGYLDIIIDWEKTDIPLEVVDDQNKDT